MAWLSPHRMLTPNRRVRSSARRIGFFRSRQISSNGGSSDTEQKALMVEPTGSGLPSANSSQVVTTVTPVGKQPMA